MYKKRLGVCSPGYAGVMKTVEEAVGIIVNMQRAMLRDAPIINAMLKRRKGNR